LIGDNRIIIMIKTELVWANSVFLYFCSTSEMITVSLVITVKATVTKV